MTVYCDGSRPMQVLSTGKTGGGAMADSEATGQLVSLSLRLAGTGDGEGGSGSGDAGAGGVC
ncbi:MAG: hypothetical protein OXQ94_16555 [Gemmatimonadota bacterium]|nr:hypothetical protein [Gemmatimonadota bacterium]